MNKHIFTGVFESPHLAEAIDNTCCLGSWATYTQHHHLSPTCLWIHGGLDVRALGQLKVWTSLTVVLPEEKGAPGPGSGLEFDCKQSVLWGSELWAQESSEGCLECDHVVGCGLEMEPPACISESLEF